MGRITICFTLFFFFCGSAATAATKDCKVGASPWRDGRQVNPATEKEYRLDASQEFDNLNKKGKTVRCNLAARESTIVMPNGFDPSVDHPGLPVEQLAWIKGCGNPIVSKFKFKFAIKSPAPAAPVVATPVVPIVVPLPVVVAQPALTREGTECHDGERRGAHEMRSGQMACVLYGVTNTSSVSVQAREHVIVRQYRQSEPEVVYVDRRVYEPQFQEEPMYYDEPQQESSWVPWAIGATALAGAAWWDSHRSRGSSAPLGHAPLGSTGGLVGQAPIGNTGGLIGQIPIGSTGGAVVGGQPTAGFTGW